MKKLFMLMAWCLAGSAAFAQNVTLDEAIRSAAREMGETLPQGSKVAVVSFTSPSEELTRYVIDELNNAIANGRRITVVDRQRLDLILGELQFQDESVGLVSEESAQEIALLGAQYIVSGSMEIISGGYRLRTQAITVSGGILSYGGSWNVINDTLVRSLAEGGILDFSAAEIRRTRALNLLWGAGSFAVQKDMLGGAIVAGLDTSGIVCLITGLVILTRAEYLVGEVNEAFDWAPGVTNPFYYTFNGQRYASGADAWEARDKEVTKKMVTGGIIAGSGALLWAAGIVVGYVRPAHYHRPGSMVTKGFDPSALTIGLVSDRRGDPALHLGYRLSF
jgi:TolB-like protein